MKAKKEYLFIRGEDENLDMQFERSGAYGKVRVGEDMLFWKEGLRWYRVGMAQIQRIYRQVEHVYGRLCCGGRSYDIQRLIVVLRDGSGLKMHIGDDAVREAEALMEALRGMHPEIQYGKPAEGPAVPV